MSIQFIPAYLVKDTSSEDRALLKLVGAIFSSKHKVWFLTEAEKNEFDSKRTSTTSTTSVVEPIVEKKGKYVSYKEKVVKKIVIDDLLTEWKVSGDTFDKRDIIKQLGGKWNPGGKAWYIPKEQISKEDLDEALGTK